MSSGLGGEGVRWRRGGNLRRLGTDEQLLHDRLRWLGLSARPWTAEVTAAWAREHGVRAEEVVEQRTTEDGEEVTVTLADGVARVSTAGSLTWAWGGVVTRELEWVATRVAGMGRAARARAGRIRAAIGAPARAGATGGAHAHEPAAEAGYGARGGHQNRGGRPVHVSRPIPADDAGEPAGAPEANASPTA